MDQVIEQVNGTSHNFLGRVLLASNLSQLGRLRPQRLTLLRLPDIFEQFLKASWNQGLHKGGIVHKSLTIRCVEIGLAEDAAVDGFVSFVVGFGWMFANDGFGEGIDASSRTIWRDLESVLCLVGKGKDLLVWSLLAIGGNRTRNRVDISGMSDISVWHESSLKW